MRFGIFKRAFAALFAASLLALLVSCLGGSGTTETGEQISLTGRVIDRDNAGVPGVVVTLAKTGLVDTTNAQGYYQVEGETEKGASGPVLDTLVFRQQNREVAALPVTEWVAALPDLKIIQRDISGSLSAGRAKIARVEGVISGDGIPLDKPVVVEFFYSAPVSHYSGFAYFTGTSAVKDYAVFVRVYDSLGRLTGRSPSLAFNSNAGNILMQAFGADNAIPVPFAGGDTLLNVGETLRLRGTAVDSFGGSIAKWEWKIGRTAGFVQTASGDTTIVLPAIPDSGYPCVLRVTDNEGNMASDTLFATVASKADHWSLHGAVAVDFTDVAWAAPSTGSGAGLWVAVGNFPGGEGRLFTSPDGVTFVRHDPGGWNDLSSLAWTGTQWVAAQSQAAYRSTDGSSWSAGGVGIGKLPRLAWAPPVGSGTGLLVAVSEGGGIFTSPDGAVWTARISGTSLDLYGILWTGAAANLGTGLFVAVGKDGLVLTSPDGIAWTPRATGIAPSVGNTLMAVAWNGSRLVAVGNAGRVHASLDGITWTPQTSGTDKYLLDVAWLGDRFIAVGREGTIRVSPDGITWSESPSGVTVDLTAAAMSGNRRVIVGKGGTVLTSP